MNSVVSYKQRGEGGSSSYRGNCSPRLIEDLINQFKIKQISDYMCGSGTTRDVAEKKKLIYNCYDLHSGFNLLTDDIKERNENIFWHPPYWDIVTYSDNMYSSTDIYNKYGYNPNEYDLSRCKKYDDFIDKLNYCSMKQFTSLEKGGYMYILMGDIKRNGKLYSMLLDIVKIGTIKNIIIKLQHNCTSDKTLYSNSNFIHLVHEYVLILQKDSPLIYDLKITRNIQNDIRDMEKATWKDIVADILENYGRAAQLEEIYNSIKGHKKTLSNRHWKEKVRQTLQIYPLFTSTQRGSWKLA
ncbi:MAG: hypothetical protein H2184_15775 [Candidatus Galacturonibacter soehngenii]|nr:hypothetical protein [Candidatus Galacturonibacter soehngenii]